MDNRFSTLPFTFQVPPIITACVFEDNYSKLHAGNFIGIQQFGDVFTQVSGVGVPYPFRRLWQYEYLDTITIAGFPQFPGPVNRYRGADLWREGLRHIIILNP